MVNELVQTQWAGEAKNEVIGCQGIVLHADVGNDKFAHSR